MKQIRCKFVPKLVIPRNAFDSFSEEYQTTDGIVCTLDFLVGFRVGDQQTEADLDFCCQKIHGCSFSQIRSIWFARLGRVDDFWYIVKLDPKKGL